MAFEKANKVPSRANYDHLCRFVEGCQDAVALASKNISICENEILKTTSRNKVLEGMVQMLEITLSLNFENTDNDRNLSSTDHISGMFFCGLPFCENIYYVIYNQFTELLSVLYNWQLLSCIPIAH